MTRNSLSGEPSIMRNGDQKSSSSKEASDTIKECLPLPGLENLIMLAYKDFRISEPDIAISFLSISFTNTFLCVFLSLLCHY